MSFMLAFYNHHREQFHLTGLFNKQESKMGGGVLRTSRTKEVSRTEGELCRRISQGCLHITMLLLKYANNLYTLNDLPMHFKTNDARSYKNSIALYKNKLNWRQI